MGEFLPKKAIRKRTADCTEQSDEIHTIAVADQGIERSGTSARKRPSNPEEQSANDGSFVHLLLLYNDEIAAHRLHFEFLKDLHSDSSDRNRGADDAVHVKGIEAKHLLNPKPGNNFPVGEDYSEENSRQEHKERNHTVTTFHG